MVSPAPARGTLRVPSGSCKQSRRPGIWSLLFTSLSAPPPPPPPCNDVVRLSPLRVHCGFSRTDVLTPKDQPAMFSLAFQLDSKVTSNKHPSHPPSFVMQTHSMTIEKLDPPQTALWHESLTFIPHAECIPHIPELHTANGHPVPGPVGHEAAEGPALQGGPGLHL